jgi:DNA repair protein RecN (Recombination protein N)
MRLLGGQRADREAVREGADELSVEGGVKLSGAVAQAVAGWLEERGLPPCEDGVLQLRRTIHREKPGRVGINGALTTLGNLAELGRLWLDIHGPGEAQTLFEEARQLELLDCYAKNGAVLARYAEQYRGWRTELARAEELRTARRLGPDEAEFLAMQADKIARVVVSAESIAALERDYTRMESSRELADGASRVCGRLQGQRGVAGLISEALQDARRISRLDPRLAELAQRIDSAAIELDDIAQDYAREARDCILDERTAKALRERMEQWMQIRRKHGPDAASALAKAGQMRQRLAEQSNVGEAIAQAMDRADAHLAKLKTIGAELTTRREEAAHELGSRSGGLLSSLGFKNAKLRFEVYSLEEPQSHGLSSCRIVFAPNPGMPPRALARIASSGELARVMLAIKTVLAEADHTPVLVFDEVDANVGGEAAVEVGRRLAELGGAHQVFAVTHLPQVASLAATHYLVEKTQSENATHVRIAPLHDRPQERIAELARMLGDRHSPEAVEHAGALLQRRA